MTNQKNEERTEAEELFLSGSSYLVLKDYKNASELFLASAKLSPSDAKYWLYLLCAMTEHFKSLLPIAREKSAYSLGKRKIVYASVFKNFITCATENDHAFARSEFNIDFSPESGEVWTRILDEILASPLSRLNAHDTVSSAHFATVKLLASNPQSAKRYFPALCSHLNPTREGVLEVNSLMYYPEASDGILRIETDAQSIEFDSDNMCGSERFSAFLLTENIKTIGSAFPFKELLTADGITEIPEGLMYRSSGIRSVKLSPTVKKIGANAFDGCVNLAQIAPLLDIEEIGDRAFYGTSVRLLDLPTTFKKLGREVLGAKADADVPIEKYLIELESSLAEKSPDFNKVGSSECGYITRKNGKFSLVYPKKQKNGKKIELTAGEKRIFEALACVSIEKTDGETPPATLMQKMKSFVANIFDRFKKK